MKWCRLRPRPRLSQHAKKGLRMERGTVIGLGVAGLLIWGVVAKPLSTPASTPASTPPGSTPPGGLPASGGGGNPPTPPTSTPPILSPPTPRYVSPTGGPPVLVVSDPAVFPQQQPQPPTAVAQPSYVDAANAAVLAAGPAPRYTQAQMNWLMSSTPTHVPVVFAGSSPVPFGVDPNALWWALVPQQLPQYGFTWPPTPLGV